MFVTTLIASLLPALIVAQYGGPLPGPTNTASPAAPSAPPDTTGHMNVDVGVNGQFIYNPSNFNATNGTEVTFWFPLGNNGPHSVTQSSFDAPCTYLTAQGNDSAGFDSGLQSAITYTITIMDDTKPIWFHCKQLLHCGMGMVGSINAPTTGNMTHAAYLQAAMNIGSNEVTETTGGPVIGGVNGVATALPTSMSGSSNSGLPSAPYNIPLTSFVCSFALVLLMA